MRRMRHRRGWIGELLKSRAVRQFSFNVGEVDGEGNWSRRTFLEDLGAVHLHQPEVRVFVLFAVTHVGHLVRGVWWRVPWWFGRVSRITTSQLRSGMGWWRIT